MSEPPVVRCPFCHAWHAYDPSVQFAGTVIIECPLAPPGHIWGISKVEPTPRGGPVSPDRDAPRP